MKRADLIAIALALVASAFGLSAGTGPVVPGLAVLVLAGLALRASSAHYIVVWAVAPLLVWATFPDPSMLIASLALAACALTCLLRERGSTGFVRDEIMAGRITLALAMTVAAGGLLSFDVLLR